MGRQSLAGVGGVLGGAIAGGIVALPAGGLGGALIAVVTVPAGAVVGAGIGVNLSGDSLGGDGSAAWSMLGGLGGLVAGTAVHIGLRYATLPAGHADDDPVGSMLFGGFPGAAFGAVLAYQLSSSVSGARSARRPAIGRPILTVSNPMPVLSQRGQVVGATASFLRVDW